MLRIHELFLTFFYFGKFSKAPGTVGSFFGMFLWLTYSTIACGLSVPLQSQNIFWGIFLIISFAYGTFAAPLYGKKTGEVDHKTIVLDEVVGQILTLQINFTLINETYFQEPILMNIHLISSFFLFRFFDIKKPSVIGYADKIKTGFGVMIDDVLAGLFAALAAMLTILLYFVLIRY